MCFVDIKGYEGLYQINPNGDVKSVVSNCLLKKRTASCGYNNVALFKNGKRKEFKEHRLVADAFIPNTYNKSFVNHINSIKTDNRVENLEWVTPRENIHHYRGKSKKIGVCYRKEFGRWISRICINGKVKNIGSFGCETMAHLSYLRELKNNGGLNKYTKCAV